MKTILSCGLLLSAVLINAQVGVGVGVNTDEPDPSAILDVVSDDKGFLPPRLTEAQMTSLTATATSGLLVYCSDCDVKCIYVYNGADFQSLCSEESLPFESIMAADGREWADRNLGATAAATSPSDTNPDAQGGLYQWGRSSDGHESPTSTVTTGPVASEAAANGDFIINGNFNWLSPNDPTLWNGTTKGTNDPCPDGWRVPTRDEFLALRDAIAAAAGSTATQQLYFDEIKLHAAGRRNSNAAGSILSGITYWTSDEVNANIARTFEAGTALATNPLFASTKRKSIGIPVRCIKEL